jgi:hypothetical protein
MTRESRGWQSAKTDNFLAGHGGSIDSTGQMKDVSVNVDEQNEMAVPGHALGSTPIKIEVLGMISEAGEVMRDRRPRQKNKQVVLRRSSAAYPGFCKNSRLLMRVNQEVTVDAARCLEISASIYEEN